MANKAPLTLQQLESLKIDSDFSECFGYENNLNGYDLLHGYCFIVAKYMKDKLESCGLKTHIEDVYVENAITRKALERQPITGVPFAHEYCVVDINGQEVFVDVRGAFRTREAFLNEFAEYEKHVCGNEVEKWHFASDNCGHGCDLMEYTPGDYEFDALCLVSHIWDSKIEALAQNIREMGIPAAMPEYETDSADFGHEYE